jgi:hypothetical protein
MSQKEERMTRERLSKIFNANADRFTTMARESRFVGGSAAVGVCLLPFNPTLGLMALAAPTIYYGVGMACRATGHILHNGLEPPPIRMS